MVNLDDLNDIIERSDSRSDKPDNIADRIPGSAPIPAGLTNLGVVDDDLQVPIKKTSAPILDLEKTRLEPEIDDSKLKTSNNATAVFSDLVPKRKLPWGWIVGGSFLFLLLGVTIYFFFSRVGFNQGTLNLTFEPVGVDVVIDGKFKKQSVSSLTIKLKSGSHSIQATKEGYLDFDRTIDITAKEQSDLNVALKPIPNIELIVEDTTKFVDLVRNGKALVYLNSGQGFVAIGLTEGTPDNSADIFQGKFNNLQSVKWSPGDPAAIVKIENVFKLSNMADNRNVVGRFIPFGESPKQGLPFNNGISTWLFSDALRTAKGWQPVLLNESIREVAFSPDGSQIIYFYETADGERSLVIAHPNGDEWERMLSQVSADNPKLNWLNDDRYVLLFDDLGKTDRLLDITNQELLEVMLDRVKNTQVYGSPDGSKILYIAQDGGASKLAMWNIATQSQEKVFDAEAKAFVWQSDSNIIVAKSDNSLWRWDLNGNEKPVKFVSSLGDIVPQKLLYSKLLSQLFIVEQDRIFQLLVE